MKNIIFGWFGFGKSLFYAKCHELFGNVITEFFDGTLPYSCGSSFIHDGYKVEFSITKI